MRTRFYRLSGSIGALGLLALAGGPLRAQAHDFWIEPSQFRPTASSVPARVSVRLLVGEHFRGEAVPRNPAHIERFIVTGPQGEADVAGVPGRDPAGYVTIGAPGLYTIGYDSHRSAVTLEADAFERYLTEMGLTRISTTRARRGETRARATELFSRCAKSLVAVGAVDAAARDQALHMRLELMAERNPYRSKPGEALPLRLLFDGVPLPGALIIARNAHDPARSLASRTGPDGRAVLRFAGAGAWLVNAVHMIPAPKDSGADWESFWASLTFELPGPDQTARNATQ